MTSTQQNPSEDVLRDGLHKANALAALLQEELALLTAGDLDSFEALQSRKAEILNPISSYSHSFWRGPDRGGSDVDRPSR